jgi:hypothetical protein
MNVLNPLTPIRGDILGTVKIATNRYGDSLYQFVIMLTIRPIFEGCMGTYGNSIDNKTILNMLIGMVWLID